MLKRCCQLCNMEVHTVLVAINTYGSVFFSPPPSCFMSYYYYYNFFFFFQATQARMKYAISDFICFVVSCRLVIDFSFVFSIQWFYISSCLTKLTSYTFFFQLLRLTSQYINLTEKNIICDWGAITFSGRHVLSRVFFLPFFFAFVLFLCVHVLRAQ